MTPSSNSRNTRPAPEHLTTYPARLKKPLLAHDFAGTRKDRVAPGGSVVDVTENTDHTPGEVVITMTVTMDGVLYARDLLADRSQFIAL